MFVYVQKFDNKGKTKVKLRKIKGWKPLHVQVVQ